MAPRWSFLHSCRDLLSDFVTLLWEQVAYLVPFFRGHSVSKIFHTLHDDSLYYIFRDHTSLCDLEMYSMEMEAVTHALRWIASRCDSQASHAIILTDSMSLLQKGKSGTGSPDWPVSMFDIHLRRILWMYCPGHAGVKGNNRADRLAGKTTTTVGLRLGRSEVLRSLRHYLWAQSQGHHTIDRLEERGIERRSVQLSALRGRERAIVKGNIGETPERRIWAFPSA